MNEINILKFNRNISVDAFKISWSKFFSNLNKCFQIISQTVFYSPDII